MKAISEETLINALTVRLHMEDCGCGDLQGLGTMRGAHLRYQEEAAKAVQFLGPLIMNRVINKLKEVQESLNHLVIDYGNDESPFMQTSAIGGVASLALAIEELNDDQ